MTIIYETTHHNTTIQLIKVTPQNKKEIVYYQILEFTDNRLQGCKIHIDTLQKAIAHLNKIIDTYQLCLKSNNT